MNTVVAGPAGRVLSVRRSDQGYRYRGSRMLRDADIYPPLADRTFYETVKEQLNQILFCEDLNGWPDYADCSCSSPIPWLPQPNCRHFYPGQP